MKHFFVIFILVIGLFSSCSTLNENAFSVKERYVILNTHKYLIFVPVKSLTEEQKMSVNDIDIITAIEYIKGANVNIEINPDNLASDNDLFIMELFESRIERLLKRKIPLFFNKNEKKWEEKYSIRYIRTPFGGKSLDVINAQGEELYSFPLFIG